MSKILIVDDSKTARAIVRNSFAGFDVDILEAADGQEGLSLAKHNHPDLIILDVAMPKVNGVKMLEKMKDDHAMKNIPVVMLTVESDKEKVVEIATLGIRDYMIKPFNENILVEKVNRLIGLKLLSTAPSKHRVSDACEILVVDSKPNVIKQIEDGLKHMPWKIQSVATTSDMLDFCENKVPDVILLSLSYPDNEAFTAYNHVRNREGCINIPIYGLAINAATDLHDKATKTGFTDILIKPIDIPLLETTITKALCLDTSRRYFSWERDSLVIKLPANTNEDILSDLNNYFRDKIYEAIDGGSRHVIVDISALKDFDTEVIQLLRQIQQVCESLTVLFKVVGNNDIAIRAREFEETQNWYFFNSVSEAFQA